MNPKYFKEIEEEDMEEGMLIYIVYMGVVTRFAFVDCVDNEIYLEDGANTKLFKLSDINYHSSWIRKEGV